jgi:hypothetical protein
MPEEYEKCMVGLTAILREAFLKGIISVTMESL